MNTIKCTRFVLMILLISCFFVTNAQESGNYIYGGSRIKANTADAQYRAGSITDTTMTIEVNSLMNVTADEYVAMFGVSQFSDSLEGCTRIIDERINGFLNALQKIGIEKEAVFIDFISQVPVFEYDIQRKRFSRTYNEIPKGFEIKKNIHIRMAKNEILTQILAIAAKYEIYDLIKVNYIVKNQAQIVDSLRKESIRIADRKMEQFKRLGIKYDSNFKVISESVYASYPTERYSGYKAFDNASYATYIGKGSNIEVKTIQKQETVYYDQLLATDYDLVINPLILKPVVQFTYYLRVRFVLKKG